MSQDQTPSANLGEDAVSRVPEAWQAWETALVVGSISVGLLTLVAVGWALIRFILP
jgi:hypothetical protein